MSLSTTKEGLPELRDLPQLDPAVRLDQCFLQLSPGRQKTSGLATAGAFLSLLLFWALRMYFTWATWGNLSIDSGREMYVPSVLLKGKMLYRDVWYLYGPVAPYFNGELYRWFGTRMEVLYWAGSLSALGCAALLLLTGKQLSSVAAGWTSGIVVLLQAFQPGLFSFPLAYSFSSVYGCLAAFLFLYFAIRTCHSRHLGWVFAAGAAATLSMLLKLEFGMACYAVLLLLVVARQFPHRSWKFLVPDLVAIIPGIVACGLVIHWMVSIRGFDFLTQENILSWPTSYFMRTYGKMWLEKSGFSLSAAAFLQAAIRASCFAGIIVEIYLLLWQECKNRRSLCTRLWLLLVIMVYLGFYLLSDPKSTLSAVFFPRDAVLYVSAASLVTWWFFWRRDGSRDHLAVAILLTFSGLVAFRILLRMSPSGYSIYYDGPAVLSFLLLTRLIIPRSTSTRRSAFLGEIVI